MLDVQEKIKWEHTGTNYILGDHGCGCFISYNPHPYDPVSIALGGDGRAETALYDGKTWYILDGDWRSDYEKLYPDFKACYEFYLTKRDEFHNKFSTDC